LSTERWAIKKRGINLRTEP